jgi:hypothetical protein
MSIDFNEWQRTIQTGCEHKYHGPSGFYRCELNVFCLYEQCPLRPVNIEKAKLKELKEQKKKEKNEVVLMDPFLHARRFT